jgi:hypothetical protein
MENIFCVNIQASCRLYQIWSCNCISLLSIFWLLLSVSRKNFIMQQHKFTNKGFWHIYTPVRYHAIFLHTFSPHCILPLWYDMLICFMQYFLLYKNLDLLILPLPKSIDISNQITIAIVLLTIFQCLRIQYKLCTYNLTRDTVSWGKMTTDKLEIWDCNKYVLYK